MEKHRYGNVKVNKEHIIEGLIRDPFLSNFFIENDLNTDVIEENLSTLVSYKFSKDACEKCSGLKKCAQDTRGLEPFLKFEDNKIKTFYKECNYMAYKNRQSRKDDLNFVLFPILPYQF